MAHSEVTDPHGQRCPIEEIFARQSDNHCVVTRRYEVLLDGSVVEVGATSNAGIACYVGELSCEYLRSRGRGKDVPRLLEGVYRQIVEEAVRHGDSHLWGWEKSPVRADYKYPHDWDDTCKAIDALRAYEAATGESLLALPGEDMLAELLEKSLFLSRDCGEDVKVRCVHQVSLYMFMAPKELKGNNTEDIMVTAVVLRTIGRHYPELIGRSRDCVMELFSRVHEVARLGLLQQIPFSHISRCYLSWGFFLWVLLDAAESLGTAVSGVRSLIRKYLESRPHWPVDPCAGARLLGNDEQRYASLLGNRIGVGGATGMKSTCEGADSSGVSLMYRHRRLGHYYGSEAWPPLLSCLSVRQERE